MNTAISQAVEEGNLYDIEDMVNAALAAGESPKELLEALMAGIKACGDRFETGEFFLPELLGSGEAFKAGLASSRRSCRRGTRFRRVRWGWAWRT